MIKSNFVKKTLQVSWLWCYTLYWIITTSSVKVIYCLRFLFEKPIPTSFSWDSSTYLTSKTCCDCFFSPSTSFSTSFSTASPLYSTFLNYQDKNLPAAELWEKSFSHRINYVRFSFRYLSRFKPFFFQWILHRIRMLVDYLNYHYISILLIFSWQRSLSNRN